jgi:hypothetical protein
MMFEEPSDDKIDSLLQMGVASSRDEAIMKLKVSYPIYAWRSK